MAAGEGRHVAEQSQSQNLPQQNTQSRQEECNGVNIPIRAHLGSDALEQLYPQLSSLSNREQREKPYLNQDDRESERVRIERLGRERPAKFKSFGAELAFCYSIIASQFMAVRSLLPKKKSG